MRLIFKMKFFLFRDNFITSQKVVFFNNVFFCGFCAVVMGNNSDGGYLLSDTSVCKTNCKILF